LSAEAKSPTGHITGSVTDAETTASLDGASVQATGVDVEVRVGAISASNGEYVLAGIPPGRYVLSASFVGYLKQTTEVVVTAGGHFEVDFALGSSPLVLGETVVSVSRRPENIIDAPASIAKVGWEDARRDAAANSFSSLLRNVKGIDYSQTGVFTESFNTRGFNTAFNTRMALLLDGVPLWLPTAFSLVYPVPKDDVQDIEVIVGPGSALYGPDAVAGVINVMTKHPADSPGTTLALAGGSRSTCKGRLRHAAARGKWGWKVSGDYQRARDFEVVNTFYNADSTSWIADDPHFGARSLRGGLGLIYSPDASSRIGFTTGGSRSTFIDMLDTGRAQRDNFTYQYQQLTFSSPRYHLNAYRTAMDGSDDFTLHGRAQSMLVGYSEEEARHRASLGIATETWGAETRCSFVPPSLGNTSFHLGADLRKTRHRDASILSGGEADVRQLGVYGHAEIDLLRQLKLALSTRTDFHNLYATQVSPKAGLVYKPRPTAAFRLTYNRAFRSPDIVKERLEFLIRPGVVARGSGDGFEFGNTTGEPLPPQFADGIAEIEPEGNTTIELGCKSILINRVFLDVSAYRSQYTDLFSPLRVIGDPSGGIFILDENGLPRQEATLTYINFGEQVVWGLDLGIYAYLSDRVALEANASFMEADDLASPGGFEQPFSSPGTMLNAVLSTSDVLFPGGTMDLSTRHVSQFDFSAGVHVGTVPAYTVVDLNLGCQMSASVTCKLTVKNLLANDHIEFVDGPEIGRLAVAEIEYTF